jgi:hypothetical protein
MLMELLARNDQCIADLPPNDEQHDLLTLNIIQHTEVSNPKFVLRHGVGS